MGFIVMNGVETYEDMQNWFCAHGWGCKWCGKLYSPNWYQASGDTYCQRCKDLMDVDPGDVVFHEYPRLADTNQRVALVFAKNKDNFGFTYAAQMRKDFERMMG